MPRRKNIELQRRAHAWIEAVVKDRGTPPTLREIREEMKVSDSTAHRWIREWKKQGRDPRYPAEEVPPPPPEPEPAPEAEAPPPDEPRPSAAGAFDHRWRLLSGHREITPSQEKAIKARAEGSRFTEIAETLGISERTLTRWFAEDHIKAALADLRTRRHLGTEHLRKVNGQTGAVLMQKTLEMLGAKIDAVISGETVKIEDVARLSKAAVSASKLAMEHGGYPKTERIIIDEEKGAADSYKGVSTEAIEESVEALDADIAELEAELRLLDGGLDEDGDSVTGRVAK